MWLYRGVQSAVFYYVTCTPCATAQGQRRRKKDAVRVQREQARSATVITDQPRIFPQPTPFSTNEGWSEEITLGPGPPARRGGHRPSNNRSRDQMDGTGLPRSSATSSTTVEDELSTGKDKKSPLGERLHWMRYQREDEPLWGEEQEVQGSSVGISGRGRAETNHSSRYYIARAPPVNDLHPPIVSGPTSKAETRWMLQPPPSARVMAGKERHNSVRDSRVGSTQKKTASGRTSDVTDEDEMQLGHSSTITKRSARLSTGPTATSNRRPSDKKRRPVPISVVTEFREDSEEDLTEESVVLRRPPLATIASRSKSVIYSRHAYDEFQIQVSSSMNSRSNSPSSLSSHVDSFCPETPYSRPDSKGTSDSGKAFHPSLGSVISPLHRNHKDVEAIHVEVNEKDSRGQEQIRPWRWSFDI